MIKKLICILPLIFIGCNTNSGSIVVASNPKDSSYIGERYSLHDLHQHVYAMVSSMLKKDSVFKDNPEAPIIALGNISMDKNIEETNFPVNAIRKSIRTNIINSGKAEFIDVDNIKILEKTIDYQNSSEYVDKETAQKKGGFVAAEYLLTGHISQIKNRNALISRTVTTLYMQLTHIGTTKLMWNAEKALSKDKLK